MCFKKARIGAQEYTDKKSQEKVDQIKGGKAPDNINLPKKVYHLLFLSLNLKLLTQKTKTVTAI
jgi:hypothetical protein